VASSKFSWVVVVTAASLALGGARTAHAHAPPEIGRVVWNQRADRVVLVTNRGLIFGQPALHDWRIMCSAALGLSVSEHADGVTAVYLPDDRVLVATQQGLRSSANDGCDWQAVEPFGAVFAASLAQQPAQPSRLFLGVFAPGRGGLYTSDDAGASWTQLLSVPDTDAVAQIVLAPSMPERIYTSGPVTDKRTGQSSYQITRSSDAGKTWERFWIPLRADEPEAKLLAASPLDPNILLVLALNASRGQNPDRVLVSRDGGANFSELLSGLTVLDAGFNVEGTRAWAAGNDALYESDAALSGAAPVGPAQFVSCVGSHAGELYACGNHSGFDPTGEGVGLSLDDGVTFQPMMAFTQVKQTVACQATSNTAQVCADLWTDWQLEILVGVGGAPIESVLGAMGSPTATAAPMPPSAAGTSSGGCTLARRDSTRAGEALVIWTFGLLALCWRGGRLRASHARVRENR
jgi:Sortilin, neurotensin receptor 3,